MVKIDPYKHTERYKKWKQKNKDIITIVLCDIKRIIESPKCFLEQRYSSPTC